MEPHRYAHLEDEQRFVLPSLPSSATAPRLIEDRYVRGTRLRLRRVTDGTTTVLKLGHKTEHDPERPSAVWHTTCYLDEVEFALLCELPTAPLAKRRWTLAGGGCADEFLGSLEGLLLAEGDRPFDAGTGSAEVTDDARFGGGGLASLDADEAAELVAEANGMVA